MPGGDRRRSSTHARRRRRAHVATIELPDDCASPATRGPPIPVRQGAHREASATRRRHRASSSAPSGSRSCSSASPSRPRHEDDTERQPRRAGPAGRHGRRRRGRPGRAAPRRARPGHLRRQGQGRGAARAVPTTVDADTVVFDNELTPGPAVQPGEAARPHRHRPHRGDPRHLRPERPQPGGQGPGRAGPAALPPAPAARGRRHRLSASRRGGIGTRGPGETQLEVDRRRIMRRITQARGGAARPRPPPRHCSASRSAAARLPHVAIVGYTNAGKSTLLNRLTDAGVLVEDRLFATLDPTTRRLDAARRRAGAASPTPSASSASCPTSWSRRSRSPSRSWPRPTCSSTSSTRRRPIPTARSTRCATVLAEIGAGHGARAAGLQQGRRRPDEAAPPGRSATRARSPSRRAPATASTSCCRAIGDRLRPLTTVVELVVPTTGATCWPRSTARARCWSSTHERRRHARCGPGSTTAARGPPRRVRRAGGRRLS